MDNEEAPFCGSKLFLRHGDRLLTYLRDDLPQIPFPAHWDLPGGGREGSESSVACALRELEEEFGLRLTPSELVGRAFPSHQAPWQVSWLFSGRLCAGQIAEICFGNEGQEWRMMPIAGFLDHPRAVPHFKDWITAVLTKE